MTRELESILTQLGLAQYLGLLVDEGFDTWEALLDIQESDLETLGVKLGHRRKLQRHIANARGLRPGSPLLDLTPAQEGSVADGSRNGLTGPSDTGESGSITKRRYRRHPKPDENAPEKPRTAYVRFSNKIREGLKEQNLTFAEKAKLVGENWQTLAADEKAEYENRANADKDQYRLQLEEYQKTDDHRQYSQYLLDFTEEAKRKGERRDSKRLKFHSIPLVQEGISKAFRERGEIASVTSPAEESDHRSGTQSPAAPELGQHHSQLPPPRLEHTKDTSNSPKTASEPSLTAVPRSDEKELDGWESKVSPAVQQLSEPGEDSFMSNFPNLQVYPRSPTGQQSGTRTAGAEEYRPLSPTGGTATPPGSPRMQQDRFTVCATGAIGYEFETVSSAFQDMEVERTEGDALLRSERHPSAKAHRGGIDGISALLQADQMSREKQSRAAERRI
ncbi:transcriptional regulator family: HMG [Purpureocillium lilacinum]|uniref:Transcriptional regulator family: HMG n=1 Tax=Purpureocillium lilacinum TaxID=33203 RepID=A0ABR0BF79_PURLI|nr:transcriptional regulator family: HMG [Purpureocillium lilacinum]